MLFNRGKQHSFEIAPPEVIQAGLTLAQHHMKKLNLALRHYRHRQSLYYLQVVTKTTQGNKMRLEKAFHSKHGSELRREVRIEIHAELVMAMEYRGEIVAVLQKHFKDAYLASSGDLTVPETWKARQCIPMLWRLNESIAENTDDLLRQTREELKADRQVGKIDTNILSRLEGSLAQLISLTRQLERLSALPTASEDDNNTSEK